MKAACSIAIAVLFLGPLSVANADALRPLQEEDYEAIRPPAPPSLRLAEPAPQALYEHGRNMRNWGIAVSVVGMVAMHAAAGFAVFCGLKDITDDPGDDPVGLAEKHGRTCTGAYVGLATGILGLGVGIPLWLVGRGDMKQALRRGYRPDAPGAYVQPTQGGAVAGVSFRF